MERVHLISIRQLGQIGGSISSSARRNLSTISGFPLFAVPRHRYHRDRGTSHAALHETASGGEPRLPSWGPAMGANAGRERACSGTPSTSVQLWTELKRKASATWRTLRPTGMGELRGALVPLTPVAFAPQYARASKDQVASITVGLLWSGKVQALCANSTGGRELKRSTSARLQSG